MVVHRQNLQPFDPDEVFGVAIGTPVGPNQRHIALVYRVDDAGPRMCHLAWHLRLCDEPLRPEYLWGGSGLDRVNKVVMAAYSALLSQNAVAVPYGIESAGPCFDEDGRYVVQPIGYGLTCATFILEVFASRGFDLLLRDEWPERPDDIVWQEQIVAVLAENGGTPEHVDAVRQHIGARRFRPEEVAAGVVADAIPLRFEQAARIAEEIVRDISGAGA